MRTPAAIASLTFSLLAAAPLARAQMEEIAPLPEGPVPSDGRTSPQGANKDSPSESRAKGPVMLEEFAVDERDVVLAAARTRTTIQEAPGLITVVTAREIAERGHRTVSEVLSSVPGFEGHRLDSNGWFDEAVVRGQPRTLLILVNGVNVTEPLRNGLSLDSRIPIQSIKRVEVTNGPGGVLWGSNALLGIVNIILKDAADLDGLELLVGGGHGFASQAAVKAAAAYGGVFFDRDLEVYGSVGLYSDRGDELTVDSQKVLGALPAPEADSKTIASPSGGITDFNSRDFWLTSTGQIRVFEQLTLDWLLELEEDHRQLATGGALLRGEQTDSVTGQTREVVRETEGNDALQMLGLSFRRRFLDEKFGLSLKVYGVRFSLDEDPFWVFPPRDLIANKPDDLEPGVVISLKAGQIYRYGLNVDADLELPADHHLIFGVEGYRETLRDARRDDRLRKPTLFPDLAMPGEDLSNAPTAVEAGVYPREVDGSKECPPPGTHRVLVRDEIVTATFRADCQFTDQLLLDADRTVGAAYLSDELKLSSALALQGGARLQVSDTYDPVVLKSGALAVNLGALAVNLGALVVNLLDDVYLKLNYAEGFRPPELQATSLNDHAVSNIGFKGNPDLNVERSRSTEAEVNALLFKDAGFVKRLYVRADYAYIVLSELVANVSGEFRNSGQRGIHAVEALGRLELSGDHEIWLGGHFNRAEDSVLGPVRNFPNVTFTGGLKVQAIARYLELTGLFTFIGPQEDLNRDPAAGTVRGEFVLVDASDIVVDRIDAYVLLRAGIRATHLFDDRLELSVFGYNLLDARTKDPDFFFEDRVQNRSQPKGGLTVFGQAIVRF